MNISDVSQYITKQEQTHYSHRLPSDHEIVREVVSFANTGKQWPTAYLDKKYSGQYHLQCMRSHGNGVYYDAEVYQLRYIGIRITVEYNGLTFRMLCMQDGTVEQVYFLYSTFKNRDGIELDVNKAGTFEGIVASMLKLVRRDRQDMLNFYNQQVKTARAERSAQLMRMNMVIKNLEEKHV